MSNFLVFFFLFQAVITAVSACLNFAFFLKTNHCTDTGSHVTPVLITLSDILASPLQCEKEPCSPSILVSVVSKNHFNIHIDVTQRENVLVNQLLGWQVCMTLFPAFSSLYAILSYSAPVTKQQVTCVLFWGYFKDLSVDLTQ